MKLTLVMPYQDNEEILAGLASMEDAVADAKESL